MIISAMLGFTSSAAEPEESPTLSVSHANLQFGSTVYLLIAVDYSAAYSDVATAMDKITVSVDGEELAADEEVMKSEEFPDGCVGFKYTSLGAKNLGDELEIKVYADGKEHNTTIYSVLEYAIQARSMHCDDTYLMDVIDKLLAFGATAQAAFEYTGDHPLADEEGNPINYGLIMVSGAAQKKAIVKAGEAYIPETAKSAPLLYDMDFRRVENNTITVKAGVERYFYISDSDRSVLSFDIQNSSALTAEDIAATNAASGSTLQKKLYGDKDGALTSTKGENLGEHILQLAAHATQRSECSLIKDGDNSAIKFKAGGSTGNIQFRSRNVANTGSANQSELGNTFTISITLGKDAANAMSAISYRLRGTSKSATRVALLQIVPDKNDSYTAAIHAKNSSGAKIASITAPEDGVAFVTVHFVIDLDNHTVSYYCGNNVTPVAVISDTANLTVENIYSTSYIMELVLERAGTTLIQRVMYTKGNIFE